MTTIYLSDKGGKHYIKCEGHATGSVEACAGISAICLTVARGVDSVIKFVAEDGLFEVEFTGQDELFRFAREGFEGMCEEYGNYCKIMA
jgi:uncharacterized protein YsxB (DUF464 family)